MKILITGGMGFVGQQLSHFFLARGAQVVAVGLRPRQDIISHENFRYISADTTRKGAWLETLEDTTAVINLAGSTIFRPWTKRYKQSIYDSRILTTRTLVEGMSENKQAVLCSTSATGYYGDGGEEPLTETSPNGADFLAEVGRDWEAEAQRAEKKGIRVVIARFGIVLGEKGGILGKMVPAFRYFLGGPLGSGRQWFPWIHVADLAAALGYLMENRGLQGIFNLCSPSPVRNRDFVRALAAVLNRPALMPAPAFLIRLFMGELGSALLCSQRAMPQKLLQSGFRFQFPDIEEALRNIVGPG